MPQSFPKQPQFCKFDMETSRNKLIEQPGCKLTLQIRKIKVALEYTIVDLKPPNVCRWHLMYHLSRIQPLFCIFFHIKVDGVATSQLKVYTIPWVLWNDFSFHYFCFYCFKSMAAFKNIIKLQTSISRIKKTEQTFNLRGLTIFHKFYHFSHVCKN